MDCQLLNAREETVHALSEAQCTLYTGYERGDQGQEKHHNMDGHYEPSFSKQTHTCRVVPYLKYIMFLYCNSTTNFKFILQQEEIVSCLQDKLSFCHLREALTYI